MRQPPKVLILYAHIQPFLLAGISALIRNYGARVLVVCWPKHDTSPTDFYDEENLTFLVKNGNSSDIEQKVFDFKADIVYSVGWMDKEYLKWTRMHKRTGTTTVMSMDAQWTGSLRQRINCLLSPFFIRGIYTHVWIPGYFQYEYARRLGFKREHILTRSLSPDVTSFRSAYQRTLDNNKERSKDLLYIGRLVPHKFEGLLSAFTSLTPEELNGWRLVVAGKGPMENDQRLKNANIHYLGFLQQPDLLAVLEDASAFCITASDEPWGTVIQEAAAAGLPLLLSRQCGAHFSFLIPGYNGYLVDGDDIAEIRAGIRKMIAHTSEELSLMGDRSNKIATADNSDAWAASLMSLHQ